MNTLSSRQPNGAEGMSRLAARPSTPHEGSLRGNRQVRRSYTVIWALLLATLPPVYATDSYAMIARYVSFVSIMSVSTNLKSSTCRWGQASVFVPSPPSILIQGGKTDPTSSFTYSSSPNSADTILLPLTTAFTTLSPPFSLLAPTGAPTYAWHTLTPLINLNGDWLVLSFGGDGGPSEPVETLADSTCILSVNPAAETVNFTHEAVVWANQPPRRIYHSAASLSTGKKTYITGGLKDDGSGAGFADVYEFDPASSAFTTLPDLPQGLYHHSSVLLPNGTLVIFGGVFKSPATGNSALLPLSTLYTLDTNSNAAGWTTRSIAGAVPDGRRGASSVLNTNGTKAFLFGGADADLGSMVGDNWELDLDSCVWRQVFSADQGQWFKWSLSHN